MVGIYKFTNQITGKSYIGQSVNIETRYKNHKYRLHSKSHLENTYFHKKLAEYGFEKFDFEVLEECSIAELDEREKYYIQKYNTLYPNGYNMEEGGTHASHSYKTTWDDVYKIQQDLKDGILYCSEIAEKYGLSSSEIHMINHGQIWVVDNETYPLRQPKPLKKKDRPVCRICGTPVTLYCDTRYCRKCYCEELRRFIPGKNELQELLKSKKQVEIAQIYGVSRNTIMKWRKLYNLDRKGREVETI